MRTRDPDTKKQLLLEAALAEFAGRLYDAGLAYLAVMRFMTWYALERGDAAPRPSVTEAMATKATAIEDAQRRGVVSDARTAGELLVLILAIANMWQRQGEEIQALVPAADRRPAIVEAVRALIAP